MKVHGKFKNREDQLYHAANVALMALWNVDAVLDLLRESDIVQSKDFPERVAGAIRIMSQQVHAAVKEVEVLV